MKKKQTIKFKKISTANITEKTFFLVPDPKSQEITSPPLISSNPTRKTDQDTLTFPNELSTKQIEQVSESETEKNPAKNNHRLRKYGLAVKFFIKMKKLSQKLQIYGTSSNLFDLTIRDRQSVKKFLYPFEMNQEKETQKNTNEIPFPLIHPNSRIKNIWEPCVVLLLTYTASIMPFRLCFIDESSYEWEIIETLIDIGFWIDLFVNMFSCYYDDEGNLIKDRKKIFFKYLKFWFFIDLIACLPFDQIEESQTSDLKDSSKIQLIRLTRLPRLYRIIKISKLLKIVKNTKNQNKFSLINYFEIDSGISRLLSLLISVFIIVHLMGCIWYYEAKLSNFGPETWVYRNDLVDAEISSLYIISLYYSFTTLATVGYGDIYSKTNLEIITSIVWMLFGVGFYSFTIGILSSVLAYMDTKSIHLQKKKSIMNEFCNEMKINNTLKERMSKTLQYNSDKNSFLWANKTDIFNDLPINLRYEIIMKMQDKVISDILFFKNCDDKFFVIQIVPLLKPIWIPEKENIWIAGSNPDAIYFLISGRVNYVSKYSVHKNSENSNENKYFIFKSMVASSYFGEIEIIFKKRREFSVVTENDSELFYLSRYDFEETVINEFPHIFEQMKLIALKRDKIDQIAVQEVGLLLKKAKENSEESNYFKSESNKENSPIEIKQKQKLDEINEVSENDENFRSRTFNSVDNESQYDKNSAKLRIEENDLQIFYEKIQENESINQRLENKIIQMEQKIEELINIIETQNKK